MATNYPNALDSLINPTGTDTLDSVTVPHASQHANANDAIEAIEATLGTNPQGSSATVKDRLGTFASLALANAFTIGGQIFNSSFFSTVVLQIKGVINQRSDLLNFRYNDTSVAGVSGVGQIYTGGGIPAPALVGGDTTATSGDGTTATITLTTASGLSIGDMVITQNIVPNGYNESAVLTGVSNTSPFTISYLNSTTGPQTTAGRVLKLAQLTTQSRSPGTVALVAKGALSQVSNLQEWQDNAGNAMANITSAGAASFPNVISGNYVTTDNVFSAFPLSGGGVIQIKKSSAASAPGTNDFARLCLLDGTTAGTLKLVIRAGTGGAQTTILDNIPQS